MVCNHSLDIVSRSVKQFRLTRIDKYGSFLSHVKEVSRATSAELSAVIEDKMRNLFHQSENQDFWAFPDDFRNAYIKGSARLALDMLLNPRSTEEGQEEFYTPTGSEDEFFDALQESMALTAVHPLSLILEFSILRPTHHQHLAVTPSRNFMASET